MCVSAVGELKVMTNDQTSIKRASVRWAGCCVTHHTAQDASEGSMSMCGPAVHAQIDLAANDTVKYRPTRKH